MGLQFSGDEIDRVVAFANASRIARPEWMPESSVVVQGRLKTNGGRDRSSKPLRGQIQWAGSWGYIRTIYLRSGGHTYSVGGANAIIEEVALDHIVFPTIHSTPKELQAALARGLGHTNLERQLLQFELDGNLHELVTLLRTRAISLDSATRITDTQPYLDLIATRLRSIAAAVRKTRAETKRDAVEVLRVLMDVARSGHDSILQMYVCEALPVYASLIQRKAIKTQASDFLSVSRSSHDTNVRLAAIIAGADLHSEGLLIDSAETVADLVRLLTEAARAKGPYHSNVKATCEALAARYTASERPRDALLGSAIKAISAHRTLVPQLNAIMKLSSPQERGNRFRDLVHWLLITSDLFNDFEIEPTYEGSFVRFDVVAFLRKSLGPYGAGFPLVVECKAEVTTGAGAVQQLFYYCKKRQRVYAGNVGVLVMAGRATKAVESEMSDIAKTDGAKMVVVDGARLRGFLKSPESLRGWLSHELR